MSTKTMGGFDSASLGRFALHIPFHHLDAVALARAHTIFLQ